MKAFAYIGLYEGIFKLILVSSLLYFGYDKQIEESATKGIEEWLEFYTNDTNVYIGKLNGKSINKEIGKRNRKISLNKLKDKSIEETGKQIPVINAIEIKKNLLSLRHFIIIYFNV